MSDGPRARYERLVREWAGRVHALAYRMLGNRADAEDATQEMFVRLWKSIDQYDPSRPFQPWIYRVATHTILNRIRGARRRASKESDAAPPRDPETTEDAVERRERESLVQESLARLDGDDRALLGMHFYGGLTQAEVAEVLDVPRTTVQSRLSKALASLRDSLRTSGHFAVLPGLEDVMRTSTPPPVPDALMTSLLDMAAAGAPAVVVPIVGGILMTKKLILAVILLVTLSLGGGFAAGYAVRGTAEDAEPTAASAERARLLAENRRLEDEIAKRGAAPTLATAGAPAAKSAGTSSPDTAGATAAGDSATTSGMDSPSSDVGDAGPDWSKFATLFAASVDRLIEMKGDDGDRMKPADKQMVMALLSEYMKASTSAHAISQRPFFDERVLPGLVSTLFGESLALPKEKRDALATSLRTLVASRAKALDFDRMGPVETFLARRTTAVDVLAAVATAAGPERQERYEKLRPIGESMLAGDHSETRLGWDGKTSAAPVGERVLARWKEAYGLDDKQMDAVRPIADRYAGEAIDVLRRRGLDKVDATPSDEAKKAADLEMLGSLVAAERAIDALLTDVQRADAKAQPPKLVFVHPGSDQRSISSSWGGI